MGRLGAEDGDDDGEGGPSVDSDTNDRGVPGVALDIDEPGGGEPGVCGEVTEAEAAEGDRSRVVRPLLTMSTAIPAPCRSRIRSLRVPPGCWSGPSTNS